MTTVQDTCRPLLKEEDAFRIALAWQEPLQERARLVPSYLTNRIVRSYEWVTLLVKSGANLEDLLEQVHVFKAACTVWFALTCCRGYSGRENPSFWKRVFATLREPRRQPSDREQPVSEHHKEYENLVTDAVRFFAEDGLEFPRVQLFQADFGHLDRAKEAPLLRLFFYGTENPTVMMQATELQMKTLVDELLQYVEPSRSCRVIPTSLYSSSLFCFPRDAVGMYDLLATVPTTTSASTVLSAPLVTCEPAFVVTALVYGQDYVEEGEKLERLRRLFQTYSIDFTFVNFVAPMPINRRYNPAQYTQLLFGTDPSVQAGVKHGCHSLCGADDPHLVAYCSALPHTRSLEMLTLSGGTSVLSAYNCAWIGYALFHPNGETSCWSDLKLEISELTMENIETLENMAMGNNLRTIQSDQTSKVTAYHRADLQSGSVIRYEATSDAEVMLTTSEGVSVDVVLLSDDDASALPEWVGVIAPSYGLGWTLASNISQLRSRSPSVSSVKSLVLESKQTREEVLLRFLTLVGPTLRFLDIVGVQEFNADTVGRILQLCPFLESFRVCHDEGVNCRMEYLSRSARAPSPESELPSDEEALREELQRVNEQLQSLEQETDDDLVQACEVLLAYKQTQISLANAKYTRSKNSASMLYAHECEQARSRYIARCAQFKHTMSDEIRREIRRLQQTRDGVSVMDRRRLTRNSVNNNGSGGSGGGGGMTTSGSGLGAGMEPPTFAALGYDASAANDDRTSQAQLAEKKRMEVLLSATPIFPSLTKTLPTKDIDADLAILKETERRMTSQTAMDERFVRAGVHDTAVIDGPPRQPSPVVNTFKRRRLMYNPSMLQEGQNVLVYDALKRSQTPTTTKPGKKATSQPTEVLTGGVITAATESQVFLRTPSGVFSTIAINDWKQGHISVHAIDQV
ncbi:hypothetical protein Poli38472_001828 [Pythium oligandrum]|uniref:Uncharacterized protein n=1 Tax=Pythium oligandrum TaxID=41045 RepID=A0A8K1CVH8_PYTOL|nr:hypothetical protein Poli38472_001828 [Pythium oligandrum]|eukprot:TMW69672.1 hypothetical protein Poli38472_001828 [Pythium oligandrum]